MISLNIFYIFEGLLILYSGEENKIENAAGNTVIIRNRILKLMDDNFLGKTWLFSSIRIDFSLTTRRDYKKHYYYMRVVTMILILFKSWVIVGPTIIREETNIMNQRIGAEFFLYIWSITLRDKQISICLALTYKQISICPTFMHKQ